MPDENAPLAFDELERLEGALLANLRQQAPALRELLERISGHWFYEDGVYRFYHGSFKVFNLQEDTRQIVDALTRAAPEDRALCSLFLEIVKAGTGREFKIEDNQHWLERTSPIVAAFLHAKFFLEMAVRYAAEFDQPPQPMPSGWAALLCLYQLR